MNNKIVSALLSLLYVPLVFVGQFIGNIIGSFLIYILGEQYWFSFIISYLSQIAYMLVGGIIGGLFTGFIVLKLYKSYNFVYSIVFPWIISICYVAFILIFTSRYIELDIVAFGDAAAVLLSILFYHFYLKKNQIVD